MLSASSAIVIGLIWALFAYNRKTDDWVRLDAMADECLVPFRYEYAAMVSREAAEWYEDMCSDPWLLAHFVA